MKIVAGFPPNIEKIERIFPKVRTSPVAFAYGDTIYSPDGRSISRHLQVHEEIHEKQQEAFPGGPDAWWDKYLEDPHFRIEQEIPAYAAQIAYIHEISNGSKTEQALQTYSRALSGPIYGHAISFHTAKQRIKKAMQASDD